MKVKTDQKGLLGLTIVAAALSGTGIFLIHELYHPLAMAITGTSSSLLIDSFGSIVLGLLGIAGIKGINKYR